MLKKRERENFTLNQSLALHAERMRIWKNKRHRLTTFVWSPGSPRAWGSEWLPVFSQPILFPLIWLNIKWTKIPISVDHFPHVLMMIRRAFPEPTNQGYLMLYWSHLVKQPMSRENPITRTLSTYFNGNHPLAKRNQAPNLCLTARLKDGLGCATAADVQETNVGLAFGTSVILEK